MADLTKKIMPIVLVVLMLAGCEETPDSKYFPGMYDSRAIEAQEADSMTDEEWDRRKAGSRVPPKGTVPVGFVKYPFKGHSTTKEAAGKYLVNPMPMNVNILARGEKMYLTYCEPCHGARGDAKRHIELYAGARNLVDDYGKKLNDGEIFHAITNGAPRMSGYASQIEVEDRWAIVNYLRLLQTKWTDKKKKK